MEQMIPKLSEHVMWLGWWFTLNQFILHAFIVFYNMEYFLGVTLPTLGRYSLYKRKLSVLSLVHSAELRIRVCFKNYRFYPFHPSV